MHVALTKELASAADDHKFVRLFSTSFVFGVLLDVFVVIFCLVDGVVLSSSGCLYV